MPEHVERVVLLGDIGLVLLLLLLCLHASHHASHHAIVVLTHHVLHLVILHVKGAHVVVLCSCKLAILLLLVVHHIHHHQLLLLLHLLLLIGLNCEEALEVGHKALGLVVCQATLTEHISLRGLGWLLRQVDATEEVKRLLLLLDGDLRLDGSARRVEAKKV